MTLNLIKRRVCLPKSTDSPPGVKYVFCQPDGAKKKKKKRLTSVDYKICCQGNVCGHRAEHKSVTFGITFSFSAINTLLHILILETREMQRS